MLPVEAILMLSAVVLPDGWDLTVNFDSKSFWKVENDGISESDGIHDPDPLANYGKENILRMERYQLSFHLGRILTSSARISI